MSEIGPKTAELGHTVTKINVPIRRESATELINMVTNEWLISNRICPQSHRVCQNLITQKPVRGLIINHGGEGCRAQIMHYFSVTGPGHKLSFWFVFFLRI